jgi:hypothetical protein
MEGIFTRLKEIKHCCHSNLVLSEFSDDSDGGWDPEEFDVSYT